MKIFQKGQVSSKWLRTRKINDWKVLLKKILKASEVAFHSCPTDYLFLEFQKIPQKNVTAPETCGVTKYRLHDAVSSFSKNFKKATPQNHKKLVSLIWQQKAEHCNPVSASGGTNT